MAPAAPLPIPSPTALRRPVPRLESCVALIATLLCLSVPTALPARAAQFTVAGAADTVAVSPGQTFTLDLVVRVAGPAFNAFDLDVLFDPTRLTNSPMSPLSAQRGPLMTSACTSSQPFHIFSATPDSLVCTMVILCNGVTVTGPGTIYRVQFTAFNGNAWTTVTFGAGTTFYNGGPRVDTLVTRPIVVKIGNPPVLDAGGPRSRPMSPELDPVSPNPGRRPGALAVSFRLPRADDAQVTLLDPQGRVVAASPRARHEAGARQVALPLPPLRPGRYTLVLRTGGGEVRTRPWVVLR